MPFVTRDVDGHVVAVSEAPLGDSLEPMAADHPEMVAFAARNCTIPTEPAGFVASDLAFIRVMEDVLEILIRKNFLTLSDLPLPAQDKLLERRALRGWLVGIAGLVDEAGGNMI